MAISLGRKQWEAFDELEDRKNTGGGLGGGRHRLYRRGRRAAEGDQNPDQYLARRAQAGRRGASAIAPGIRRRLQGAAGGLCEPRRAEYCGAIGPVAVAQRFHGHAAQFAGEQRLRDSWGLRSEEHTSELQSLMRIS